MISDIAAIDREITALESKQATMPVIEKLAMLYIVKDHNSEKQNRAISKEYSRASWSDFAKLMTSKPFDKVVEILEEHFEVIKALYPKEYESIIMKLKEL